MRIIGGNIAGVLRHFAGVDPRFENGPLSSMHEQVMREDHQVEARAAYETGTPLNQN